MNKISFSVIMPTYNRSFCIRNAIDSLLAQTYQYYELVIVDDGSTDGTGELIAETYAAELASGKFVYTRHEKNQGLNATRNTGLSMVKNEWVVYLDDDNTLKTNYLETYAKAITEYPDYKIFYSRKHDGENGGYIYDYALLLRRCLADCGTLCHHISVCKLHGLFDESIKRATEWDFFIRIARYENVKYIPETLINYNYGDWPRITNTESSKQAKASTYAKLKQAWYPFFDNVLDINSIYILFDTGHGYSDDTTKTFYHFPIRLSIKENNAKICIKPSPRECIIRSISIKTGDGAVLKFTTNACITRKDVFFFDVQPKITVLTTESNQDLTIDMKVYAVDKDVMRLIKREYQEVSSLLSSRSWKITKPLRWIGKLIRKVTKK